MVIKDNQIQIFPELNDFVVPLKEDELLQLEENLKREGCREPLIVWKKGDENILIDGHNRFKICTKNDIPFRIHELEFDDIEEVKVWIINNQLGRRNLNPDQLSYYRGLKYEKEKKQKGGNIQVLNKGNLDLTTSHKLAEEFKISPSTIKRDAKYAQGIDFIGKLNPELRKKIITGDAKIKKSDVILFAEGEKFRFRKITDEYDVRKKAVVIRESVLQDLEGKIKKQKEDREDRVMAAREELRMRDEAFPSLENRIKQVKGNIISLINRAIEKRDHQAIDELKDMIERLEELIFSN